MLPKQSTAKINPLVQQKKLSGTQNKDKLAHSQKLQVFFFMNKKEKKETTNKKRKKQMKLAAIGAVKDKQ